MSQESIKAALRANPDGMTVAELARHTGKDRDNIAKLMKKMGGVYIDRWQPVNRGPLPYSPVYVMVEVPEDAPMPD